jgi:SAM-dependent methyltransferase
MQKGDRPAPTRCCTCLGGHVGLSRVIAPRAHRAGERIVRPVLTPDAGDQMLTRAWRIWRAKASLLASVSPIRGESLPKQLLYQELRESADANCPERSPYEALAKLWHRFSSSDQANYTTFLQGLARSRGKQLQSVLDLACGTGRQTECLALTFPDVVGLDASEAMLAEARIYCAKYAGVPFERGDFRFFDLGRQFDAVVCASDSLNYVAHTGELGHVFQCVAQHLRIGGLFVFDTITQRGMQELNGRYNHAVVGGQRMAIHFEYEPTVQKEVSTVMLAAGIETHRRIPIDPEDVIKVASGTGLEVDEYFSSSVIPGKWHVGARCFFVLSKRTGKSGPVLFGKQRGSGSVSQAENGTA